MSESVSPALPAVWMELNRGQGRGGGAESGNKGTKEEIQTKGSNWEERRNSRRQACKKGKGMEWASGKGTTREGERGTEEGGREERGKEERRSQHARAPPASEEEVAGPACQTGCSLFGPSFCSQCYRALQQINDIYKIIGK